LASATRPAAAAADDDDVTAGDEVLGATVDVGCGAEEVELEVEADFEGVADDAELEVDVGGSADEVTLEVAAEADGAADDRAAEGGAADDGAADRVGLEVAADVDCAADDDGVAVAEPALHAFSASAPAPTPAATRACRRFGRVRRSSETTAACTVEIA
jgi:hypothetical protein